MSEIKVFAKDYPMAPIDKFIPYANNARTHSKEQINKLRSIYRGIGYGDPVEVDENFTILSGHGRVEVRREFFPPYRPRIPPRLRNCAKPLLLRRTASAALVKVAVPQVPSVDEGREPSEKALRTGLAQRKAERLPEY